MKRFRLTGSSSFFKRAATSFGKGNCYRTVFHHFHDDTYFFMNKNNAITIPTIAKIKPIDIPPVLEEFSVGTAT